MKVFFDTNVYIAEALLGRAAERMVAATLASRWRIYTSPYALDELERVMKRLGFSSRLAKLTQDRVRRRSVLVTPPPSRHAVRSDPQDGPIVQAAVACSADYLVTNDQHLLALHPYEGVQIISMDHYLKLMEEHGYQPRNRGAYWKMSPRFLEQCGADTKIKGFEFRTRSSNWWGSELTKPTA